MTIIKNTQAALAALLIAASPIHAATITVLNTDDPGEGYNDPGAPAQPQRREETTERL